jgi:hypothetical protein
MSASAVRLPSRLPLTLGLLLAAAAAPWLPARAGDAAPPRHWPTRTEAELTAELARAPEVSLQPPDDMQRLFLDRAATGSDHPALGLFDTRPDLRGLPVRRGAACQLAPVAAKLFDQDARALRAAVATLSAIRSSEPAVLRIAERRLLGPFDPEAVAPLMLQMLQCGERAMRERLVGQMRRAAGPASTQALAHRALFETDPALRQDAITALANRQAADVRPTLLAGFRHPWPAAADHAAAALAALNDRDAVPALLRLLDEPAPPAPVAGPDGVPLVREVVRINHARNCQLCHAPSWDRTDPARVTVPAPDQPLSPPFSSAYYAPKSPEPFVRADVTYLRQDFSMMLPVANPGPWPTLQRFDFFVRTRQAEASEAEPAGRELSPQSWSVLRALRHLTGRDFGERAADWRAGLSRGPRL